MEIYRYLEFKIDPFDIATWEENIPKLGKLSAGDIIQVLNGKESGQYMITGEVEGKFEYMKVPEFSSVEDTFKWGVFSVGQTIALYVKEPIPENQKDNKWYIPHTKTLIYEITQVLPNGKYEYKEIHTDNYYDYLMAHDVWTQPTSDFKVEWKNELPTKNIELFDGFIARVWKINKKYYIYRKSSDTWEIQENIPAVWRFIKLNGNPVTWSTCSNSFTDKYIYEGWGHSSKFENRGLPEDVSDELKEYVSSEKVLAYITEYELTDIASETIEALKIKLQNARTNDRIKAIDEKLDILLKKKTVNTDEEDEFYEDTFDYIYDDCIYDVINPDNELEKLTLIKHIVDYHYNILEARIIYTCEKGW